MFPPENQTMDVGNDSRALYPHRLEASEQTFSMHHTVQFNFLE